MNTLVVKATSGQDRPEACAQAFTVASSAQAVGATVSLWLTGDAVWLAVPGRAAEFELAHAPDLAAILEGLLADPACTVTACSQCLSRRDLTQADLLDGVVVAGAASFAAEVLADGVQALVY